jgi:hypothetical protein
MGILTHGILGPMINTTGAVIGTIKKGQNVITSLRRESNPETTAAQAEQRYRFKLLKDFIEGTTFLIEGGFNKKKMKQSVANAAFQYNYSNAFYNIAPLEGAELESFDSIIKLNLPALVYSIGPVSGPNCGTAVRNADHTCTFSWLEYPQSKNHQNTDSAGFLIWNASTGKAQCDMHVANRGALTFTVPIAPKHSADELHFYMHFDNPTSKTVGDSIYLGSTLE